VRAPAVCHFLYQNIACTGWATHHDLSAAQKSQVGSDNRRCSIVAIVHSGIRRSDDQLAHFALHMRVLINNQVIARQPSKIASSVMYRDLWHHRRRYISLAVKVVHMSLCLYKVMMLNSPIPFGILYGARVTKCFASPANSVRISDPVQCFMLTEIAYMQVARLTAAMTEVATNANRADLILSLDESCRGRECARVSWGCIQGGHSIVDDKTACIATANLTKNIYV